MLLKYFPHETRKFLFFLLLKDIKIIGKKTKENLKFTMLFL